MSKQFTGKTVLHVIDTTGPGGAETVFVELAAGLDPQRYRSLALIRGPGWVDSSLRARDVPVFTLDCKGSFNLRYLWALIQLIRREKIDVIQAHLLGSNVYCSLAGLLTGRRVITTFHGGVDVHSAERFLALKFGLIRLGARRVVAVSSALADELIARTRLPRKKLAVIHNGIDTQRYRREKSRTLRARLGLGDEVVVMGALGNIRPAKDYPTLLEAFALVAAEYPTAHLVIAGQGYACPLEALSAQCKRLGVEQRVHFLGFVEDPAEYLANLDVFVLSSSSEGFSIATIQAMAAGLPVVATRCGGPEEILREGDTGLLVQPQSPGALAAGLSAVLGDAGLRERLSASAAADVVHRFGIETMLRTYSAYYED